MRKHVQRALLGVMCLGTISPVFAQDANEKILPILKEIAALQAKQELVEKQMAAFAAKKIKLQNCAYPSNYTYSGVGTDGVSIDHAWNTWDRAMEGRCPADQVMVGKYSVHHNHFEDRMEKYQCCSLVLAD